MTLPTLTTPIPAAPLTGADDVVARVRRGEVEAFDALYLAWHAPLWKFAFALVRSADVAEELVQDVFLSLWAGRRDWVVRTTVAAWLYGAIRNRALNHRRHERVVARTEGGVDAEAALSGTMGMGRVDAHAMVEADELRDEIDRALGELSERCRQAIALRWKHDLSAAEIAEVLDASPGAVRVMLTRGRQELARLLGRR